MAQYYHQQHFPHQHNPIQHYASQPNLHQRYGPQPNLQQRYGPTQYRAPQNQYYQQQQQYPSYTTAAYASSAASLLSQPPPYTANPSSTERSSDNSNDSKYNSQNGGSQYTSFAGDGSSYSSSNIPSTPPRAPVTFFDVGMRNRSVSNVPSAASQAAAALVRARNEQAKSSTAPTTTTPRHHPFAIDGRPVQRMRTDGRFSLMLAGMGVQADIACEAVSSALYLPSLVYHTKQRFERRNPLTYEVVKLAECVKQTAWTIRSASLLDGWDQERALVVVDEFLAKIKLLTVVLTACIDEKSDSKRVRKAKDVMIAELGKLHRGIELLQKGICDNYGYITACKESQVELTLFLIKKTRIVWGYEID